jgi:diguanylate cyclase (GGDEF)-like protein
MSNAGKEKKLEYLDDLTGLYNRRYFRERVLEEKRNVDQSSSGGFALMMIDLDNFKPINDTYGHLTGDQVLIEVGRLLKESIRSTDILCRYAGDEFVVILPETNENEVIRVSERIKENFAKANWLNDKGDPIQSTTCSLGYSFYSEKGSDLNQLIGWADQALYVVKRRGGNGYFGGKELPVSTGRPLSTTPQIVGREKEMRQLRSLIEVGDKKNGKFVLIHGEAGIGKTRLIKEIQHIIEKRGGLTLLGSCHEETRSIPYYPFREAFNRFFEVEGAESDTGEDPLQDLPEYARRELTKILPGLTEITPSELDRAPDSFRLFESVRLLLQNLSPRFGLFIIENLHWSDEASLDLIQYLARNLKSPSNSLFNKGRLRGILLCGTYRTEEVKGDSRFVRFSGSLRKEELSEEIPLKPLSAEGVSNMLHQLFGGTKVSQDFQNFLHQKTEGNPFFVEQIIKFLSEEEISGFRTPPKKLEIPRSIHALLERRIDHLAPEMRKILACAALIGEEFDFEVLKRVLDQPEKEILDAVEAGVAAHIVQESFEREGDRFRFIHALMADVLYSSIGKTRRRMWHGRAGDILEDVYSGRLEVLNGQLAYHFEQGERWEKVIEYTLKWAEKAKDEYANKEAVRLYKKTKEILPRIKAEPDSGIRENEIAVTEGLGDVYRLTGEWDKALQEFQTMEEIARNIKDEIKEGEANYKISRVYHLQGNNDEAINYCERSFEIFRRIEYLEGIANSLYNTGNVHKSRGNYEEALKCFEESLKIGKKIGNKITLAKNLNNIGLTHLNRGEYVEALKYFKEHLKIEREIGDKRGMAKNLHNTGLVYLSSGDFSKALKFMKESLNITREIGYM